MRLTDEELVARHLGGDPDAFAELVARYTNRLFNLAYRFTGDPVEAEDIAQETFLRAYAALPRSRAGAPFKPWLFQIAVNLCRDRARRKRSVTFTALEGGEAEGDSSVDDIPDEAPLPLELAEAHDVSAALQRALMALPEAERVLLTLRYNEELSYDEIGQLLGLPSATIGVRLFRAKLRLRAALAEAAGVDYDRTP